jgi:hypothetical protein
MDEKSEKILRIIINEYVDKIGEIDKKTLETFEIISKKIIQQLEDIG